MAQESRAEERRGNPKWAAGRVCASWFVSLMVIAGCGSAPDENSGGDAYRNEALAIPLGDWATGEVNADDGDSTDWKSVPVSEEGTVKVELSAETKGSSLNLAVFDAYGRPLGDASVKGGGDIATVPVKVSEKATLFVKVSHRGGPKTVYSVRAVVPEEGGGGGGGPDL